MFIKMTATISYDVMLAACVLFKSKIDDYEEHLDSMIQHNEEFPGCHTEDDLDYWRDRIAELSWQKAQLEQSIKTARYE